MICAWSQLIFSWWLCISIQVQPSRCYTACTVQQHLVLSCECRQVCSWHEIRKHAMPAFEYQTCNDTQLSERTFDLELGQAASCTASQIIELTLSVHCCMYIGTRRYACFNMSASVALNFSVVEHCVVGHQEKYTMFQQHPCRKAVVLYKERGGEHVEQAAMLQQLQR